MEIPLDEHGFFGRQCPWCQRTLLVANASYDTLPDDIRLWCVYCGRRSDHNEFMTSQQTARIMSLAARQQADARAAVENVRVLIETLISVW